LRRVIKQQLLELRPGTRHKAIEAVREKIKLLELDAEKIEQDMLNDWAHPRMTSTALEGTEAAIRSNVDLLLQSCATAGSPTPTALIQASLAVTLAPRAK
jgi:hypothetical protein